MPHNPVPNVVRENFHIGGLFHNATPGRADKIPVSVPSKSYVIPADVVSGIGQGNTMAGGKILDDMFGTPYGVKGGHSHAAKGLAAGGSSGGGISQHGSVPIMASGGEYLVHPDAVKRIGEGDMDHGHEVLDHFVLKMRKKIVDKTKKLAPPKGSKNR